MQILIDALLHLRDTFNDHIVFSMGVLLVIGYFAGKLAERVRLPAITGYIVAGLLLGDAVTGVIHAEMTKTLRTVTEVALGIIAITIGSEFALPKIRRLGPGILTITLVQLFGTFFIVALALFAAGLAWSYSMLLGAIASATAPAATVVIIQNLRARGDFVDTLYGVVALDDAGCVLLFSAVYAFVFTFIGPAAAQATGGMTVVVHAVTEIVSAIGLGAAQGLLMRLFTWRVKRDNERLIIALGSIFLFTAVAISLELSPLLTNMMAGAVLANISNHRHALFRVITPLTPPLYAAFFAIAGTELDIAVLGDPWVLALGSIYVIARATGKYAGVWAGARACRAPASVRNYLGLSMLPQAGVAIGLVLFLQASPLAARGSPEVQQWLMRIANIVLFAVFVNELAGPPLSRFAIVRGMEKNS
ncbi:cation:proton antiporter [Kiritimatiella glycovorans]|uniref:Potassium/proton antiporter n=1 Tax=Kiritimatiella glycovorans TaxID=1307763 RepID=A0A0G3EAI0_9BACT|nr:cation:proton antiporter [Kiritimatiella glycovorans]AKJ63451.1 potassium/proton antiporter [Kiritimatiella glycovorans]